MIRKDEIENAVRRIVETESTITGWRDNPDGQGCQVLEFDDVVRLAIVAAQWADSHRPTCESCEYLSANHNDCLNGDTWIADVGDAKTLAALSTEKRGSDMKTTDERLDAEIVIRRAVDERTRALIGRLERDSRDLWWYVALMSWLICMALVVR